MGYKKPQTITFTFNHTHFDRTGSVTDENNDTQYRFYDHGDEHGRTRLRSYPMSIIRVRDRTVAANIEWHSSASRCTVAGLEERGPTLVRSGVLDENLAFRMSDGSKFQWSGNWGQPFRLYDYRAASPYSNAPTIAAHYRPSTVTGQCTQLEVDTDALLKPWFLEYCIVTTLWLEYQVHDMKEAAAAGQLGGRTVRAVEKR